MESSHTYLPFRNDIQLLRGIAVLFVLLYHLQITGFEHGFLGVDIFFVISGFLMAKLYDKCTAFEFYKRRLNRLFPAYAITIFVTLIIGYILLIPVDFHQLINQALTGIVGVSNILFWSQNSYFSNTSFNPLLNTWSLCVELQFYIILPLLFLFIRKNRLLFMIVFVGSLAACVICQYVSQKLSFFMMPLRVWEFLIGTYVAWSGDIQSDRAKNYHSLLLSSLLLLLLALGVFLAPIYYYDYGSYLFGHPSLGAFVVTIITGILIKLHISDKIVDSFIGKILVKIGDLSYSIYLVHFPVIVLVNYSPFKGTILGIHSIDTCIYIILLTIICSLLSYIYIEKKYNSFFKLKFVKLYLVILVLISTPLLNYFNKMQYSKEQNNIFAAYTDRSTYRCGKLVRILHPSDQICPISKVESHSKNILLIGNSHADSIKTVFSEEAKKYHHSVFFCVSNIPLMGGTSAERLFSEAVDKNIDVFVLHYFDTVFQSKNRIDEVKKFIDLANKNNKPVYFIGFIPIYSQHVPLTMYNRKQNDLIVKSENHKNRIEKYTNTFSELKAMGVKIYDPAPYFYNSSNNTYAFASLESEPYYFDAHHLTLTGSRILIPLFDTIFEDMK